MALNANALALVATLQTDVSGLSTGDAERFINAASQLIEDYCGRKFQRGTITEKVAGYGRNRLLVKRTPLESLTSIVRVSDSSTVDSASYSVEAGAGSEEALAGFIYRSTGWDWTAAAGDANGPYYMPGTELRDYTVVYVGGYLLPNDSSPSPATTASTISLPTIITEACLLAASRMARTRGRDNTISAESMGNASVQYTGGAAGRGALSSVEKGMLAAYRVGV